jgi:hypothetical protein
VFRKRQVVDATNLARDMLAVAREDQEVDANAVLLWMTSDCRVFQVRQLFGQCYGRWEADKPRALGYGR